jgi:hypothetical protein
MVGKKTKGELRWKSVYEAPVEEIKEIFRDIGKELTEEELNDIILAGKFP